MPTIYDSIETVLGERSGPAPRTWGYDRCREVQSMSRLIFTVVVVQDEDGMYVASAPALHGCYAQGDTPEEALHNMHDAMSLDIEARRELAELIPTEVAVQQVEVNA
jgi:predicted RNase H-like HicB family nuclease